MNRVEDKDEFYIGWLPKAPVTVKRHTKKVLFFLLPAIIIIAVLLSLFQKQFGSGNFEFGTLTELKGIYFQRPVPCIKVTNGRNIFGQLSYISIPLIGFGKAGVDGVIAVAEQQRAVSFDQKEVTLKGTLLYNDGKLLMQLDANDNPIITVGELADKELLPVVEELGDKIVKGEIVDPKCYFGVMKPGEGKPHKDCAIRCILGGITPVLRVMNEQGETNYYMVLGANGEKMNQRIKDFVAEPVALHASVVKVDDWIVLYVKDGNSIERISGLDLARPGATAIACARP
jgi:hypothetical protein